MKKTLIVDLQVFQSPAWFRGMGKYTLELLSELSKDKEHYSLIMGLLSTKCKNPRGMMATVKHRLPNIKMVYLDLAPDNILDPQVRTNNRKIIDDYINGYLTENKDLDSSSVGYFIPSPMQGFISAPFPSDNLNIQKIALCHDLIPLILHKLYLGSPITRQEYLSRIYDLLRADIYVTNSKTTANDLATYLCVDKSRIISIDGGPADHSKVVKYKKTKEPFILMPTGNDIRKNNERAIKAFDLFNNRHQNKYTLYITSYFKDFQIKHLSQFSNNIVFTGNISDGELAYLYKESEAVFFPPEYEGLGMPIIEAIKHNKPVACSNISVFREMSNKSFTFFNLYSIPDMARALEEVVTNPRMDIEDYNKILKKYSWNHTSRKFSDAISKYDNANKQKKKKKIALFMPSPSIDSYAGKEAQRTHGELSRLVDIDYFFGHHPPNKPEQRINYLPYISKSKYIGLGMGFKYDDYYETVYFIDGSEDSALVLFTAIANPGTVILYDSELTKTWVAMVRQGLILQARYKKELELANILGFRTSTIISLILNSNTVIVTDDSLYQYIVTIASKLNPNLKVLKLNMPINSLPYDSVMPKKTLSYIELDNLVVRSESDFSYNTNLEQARLVIVGKVSIKPYLADLLRFGNVLLMNPKKAENIIPLSIYIQSSSNNSDFADSLEISNKVIKDKRQAVNNFTKSCSSYKEFAQNIYDKVLNNEQNNT